MFYYLSYFDIFKIPIFFYYEGHTRASTKLGIFFSFMIFSFLIFQFIHCEFFAKHLPLVITQSMKNSDSSKISFNKNSPLLMTVTDPITSLTIIDPTIFTINAQYSKQKNTIITEIHACNTDEINYNESSLSSLKMTNVFCFIDPQFSLETSKDENSFDFLQISLDPCQNSSENNNSCKSQEEINNFLGGKVFTFGYGSVELDATEYLNPLKAIPDPPMIYIDNLLSKTNVILLKKIEVLTDDHWLFPEYDINVKKGVKIKNKKFDYQIRNNFSKPLLKWTLIASKEKTICIRKYQKLPEALASLSSMAHLEIILCGFIVHLYSYVSFLRSLLNNLYDFEEKKRNKKQKENEKKEISENEYNKKKDMKTKKIIIYKSNYDNICVTLKNSPEITQKNERPPLISVTKSENFMSNGRIKPKLYDEESIISKDNHDESKIKTKFSLNIFEYLLYKVKTAFCFNRNEKQKIIEKAEKKFKKKMDIVYLQRQLQKIDFIKNIFLDKEQRVLFKCREKPLFMVLEENEKKLNEPKKEKTINNYAIYKEFKIRNGVDLKLLKSCDLKKIGITTKDQQY